MANERFVLSGHSKDEWMNPSGPVVTAFIDFLLHPPETSDSDIAVDNNIDRIMPTVKRECMNAGVDWDS